MLRLTAFGRCDTIVVGVTHSSGARNALRWAVRTAIPNDALLIAVTAFDVPTPVLTMYGWACFDSHDAEAAARFMQHNVLEDELPARPSSLRVRRTVMQGDPVRVLSAVATDADLLVIGRPVHRLRHIAAASVSKGLANRAGCPVVIVRGDVPDRHAEALTLERVGMPVYAAGSPAVTAGSAGDRPHQPRKHARFERRRH